jgi:hypothetical protein
MDKHKQSQQVVMLHILITGQMVRIHKQQLAFALVAIQLLSQMQTYVQAQLLQR